MASTAITSERAPRCQAAGVSVILLNRSRHDERLATVTSDNGFDLFALEADNYHDDEAKEAARRMFSGTKPPGAVFVANDHMAFAVMGISHAEFGPFGLRRKVTLIDETAIWKHILLQTG